MGTEITPSKTELRTRKILGTTVLLFALLIVLLAVLTELAFLGALLFLLPFSFWAGVYLFKNKEYHLRRDVILFAFGFFLYTKFIPFLFFPPLWLKLPILTFDPANSAQLWIMMTISALKIIIFAAFIYLFACDVLVRLKFFTQPKKRDRIGTIILIATISSLLVIPLFQTAYLPGAGEGAYSTSGGGWASLKLGWGSISISTDPVSDSLMYNLMPENELDVDVEITEVYCLKPSGGLSFPEKEQLAPPFGNIEVFGGEKLGDRIIIKSHSNATLKIFSKERLASIILVEKTPSNGALGRNEIIFLSLDPKFAREKG